MNLLISALTLLLTPAIASAWLWSSNKGNQPDVEPLSKPLYVMKLVKLLPGTTQLPHCDHGWIISKRSPCDYRVRFEVLFHDHMDKPYVKWEFNLPDNQDFYDAPATYDSWPYPLPNPSYPGAWASLNDHDYKVMHISNESILNCFMGLFRWSVT